MNFKKTLACTLAATSVLSSQIFANSAYDTFYSKYGYEKSADVYYNGTKMFFDDVQPLIENGTTFMPIRSFSETIGGEVFYDDATQKVTIINGDTTISFIVGSADVSVNDEIITLPVNTFLTEARTMVPVRLISEAFGLDVSWNNDYREVLIMDLDALTAGLNFTIIDKILATANSLDSNINKFVTGDIKIGYDDGENNYAFSSTIETIIDKNLSSMQYDLDCAIDLGSFAEELNNALNSSLVNDAEMEILEKFADIAKSFKFSYVLDMDKLDVYLKSEMLELFAPVLGLSELASDTWVKISYSDMLPNSEYQELLNQVKLLKETTAVYSIENFTNSMIDSYKLDSAKNFNYYVFMKNFLTSVSDENFVDNKIEGSFALESVQSTYSLKVDSTENMSSYELDFTFFDGYSTSSFNVSQPTFQDVIITADLYDSIVDVALNFKVQETEKQPTIPSSATNLLSY